MKFSEQEIKVYSNERGYFTRLSKRDLNNEWMNGFFYLQFKRNVVINNKSKIKIKDAWLSFYINKDKKTVWYIFVNDYEDLGIIANDDSELEEIVIPDKN